MTRRTMPFGYKYENGQIIVEKASAGIVSEIYDRYVAGESMLNISSLLNKLNVQYSPGIVGWNKARIKRILENEHYVGDEVYPQIVTEEMFEQAKEEWQQYGYSEMVPFWCLPREVVAAHKTDGVLEWIERIVPMYPMSLDQGRYQHLIDILSMYRLTMGQPRQEELLELLKGKITPEDMHKLLIDLSPYNKNNGSTN